MGNYELAKNKIMQEKGVVGRTCKKYQVNRGKEQKTRG
jgi:hypothetical protein